MCNAVAYCRERGRSDAEPRFPAAADRVRSADRFVTDQGLGCESGSLQLLRTPHWRNSFSKNSEAIHSSSSGKISPQACTAEVDLPELAWCRLNPRRNRERY